MKRIYNVVTYLVFALAIYAIIIVWSNSYAQESPEYQQYTNDTYGIEIKYPSEWEVDSQNYYEGTRYTGLVTFYSLLEDIEDEWRDNVEIVTDNIPYKNIDLGTYLEETIDSYGTNKDFRLISSSQDATLAGFPAYKITWTETLEDDPEIPGDDSVKVKKTEVGAIIGNKSAVTLTYTADPETYNNYLSVFNHMVDSFKTTTETSGKSVTYDMYTNPNYGIQTKYPSDWNVNRSDYEVSEGFNGVAEFTSGLVDSEDVYDDRIMIAHFQAPIKKLSVEELMNELVKEYETFKGFHLVSSDQGATLAGLPAFKVTWTSDSEDEPPIKLKSTQIGALVGENNGFLISYGAAEDTYNNYLPIFNEMIESFKTSIEENTTTTLSGEESQGFENVSETTQPNEEATSRTGQKTEDTAKAAAENDTAATETDMAATETDMAATENDTATTVEFQGISSPASEGFQAYKNDYFGIGKLLYPSGWSVNENETTLQLSSPSEGNSSQSIFIDTYLTENRTLQDFAADDYNYYLSKPEELAILEFKPIKLKGNQSAQLEIIDHYQESGLFKELLVLTVKNDLLYVFDYFAPAQDYLKYISTVTNMLKSLDLSIESDVVNSEEIREPPAYLSPL